MNYLRIKDIEEKIRLKKSKIYNLISEGLFPKPFKVGAASLWTESEVDLALKNLRLKSQDVSFDTKRRGSNDTY